MAETPSVMESRWSLLTLFILFRGREGAGGNNRGMGEWRDDGWTEGWMIDGGREG